MEVLKVTGGTGLTSCLNVRLHEFLKWMREKKTTPDIIDSNGQFSIYRDVLGQDISDKLVYYDTNRWTPDSPENKYLQNISYDHGWQYGFFDTWDTPLIEVSFANSICNAISKEVGDIAYNISKLIGDRTCVLYRGNDKGMEIPRLPYDVMIDMAIDTGEKSFFVQTDEQEFADYFKERFPDTVTWDEIPRIHKNPDGNVMPPVGKRVQFAINFNAVLYAMGKAKKVIVTTGNTGEFVCLYRGNTNNVWQAHGFERKWRKLNE